MRVHRISTQRTASSAHSITGALADGPSSTDGVDVGLPDQGAKGRRSGVDVIIVCATWECAQLLDKRLIPRPLDQLDHAVLALCRERIGAILFRTFLAFLRDSVPPSLLATSAPIQTIEW